MCSNLKESKLNALRKTEIESTEKPKTLTVIYGPYMSWGKWNANTSRIEVFLKMLLKNNFNVQLKYEKDKLHYVSVLYNNKILFEHKDVQHNSNYYKRELIFNDCFKSIIKLTTSKI